MIILNHQKEPVPYFLRNKNKISLTELCSGSRRHEIVKARRIVSWAAVRELGYSGAEVARYLGVTNSCVTRFLSSGGKPNMDGII